MIDCRVIARVLGLLILACAATVSLRAGWAATSEGNVPENDAARLLELGDRYSPAALAKARELHAALQAKAVTGAEVEYAFALVLIRQHAYPGAIEALDSALREQPRALHLWRAKIWTEMALRKHRDVVADVRKAAELLGKQDPAELPATQAAEWHTTAEFLGRVFGFLEAPRSGTVTADELRRAKQAVLAKLGADSTDFTRNEELVAARFTKARAEFEQRRAKRLAEGEARQESLKKQQRAVDETATDIDYDAEKLKSNTKAEVDRINQSLELINKNILMCQFRMNVVVPLIARY
ncbi:MAG TPA: hypothetical protein VMF30_00695, partial [Pirellulales bacterium]|nr:hypothetical protein [Pirellulales bacterium]